MEKRQPLSVMIALQSKKLKGGSSNESDSSESKDTKMPDRGEDDAPPVGGKYDDEGMIAASEDAIDAFKNRDAKALNTALINWMDLHGGSDSRD